MIQLKIAHLTLNNRSLSPIKCNGSAPLPKVIVTCSRFIVTSAKLVNGDFLQLSWQSGGLQRERSRDLIPLGLGPLHFSEVKHALLLHKDKTNAIRHIPSTVLSVQIKDFICYYLQKTAIRKKKQIKLTSVHQYGRLVVLLYDVSGT